MNPMIMLVFVSCPDKESATFLAKLTVERRLVACAQLIHHVESYYFWKEKLENSNEVLLLLKTSAQKLSALQELVLENHPYEIVEFLAVNADHVASGYHNWLFGELNCPWS